MKANSILLNGLLTSISTAAIPRRQVLHGTTASSSGTQDPALSSPSLQSFPYNADPVNKWLPEGLAKIAKSFNELTTPARIANVTSLAPRIKQEAKRRLVRFGPFHLSPMGTPTDPADLLTTIRLDPEGQILLLNVTGRDGFCSDCTILSGQMGLEFENGTKAELSTGVYMHHVLTRDVSKYVKHFISACPTKGTAAEPDEGPTFAFPFTGAGGAEFINAGNDNKNDPTRWSGADNKFIAGYHVKQNDVFSMVAEIVNYHSEEMTVYLTHDVEYLPSIQGRDIQQTEIAATGCSMSDPFTSPTEATNTTSDNYIIFTDGDIIDSKGHLHDGGVKMYMFVNDKFICSSDAEYGGPQNETILKMTHCTGPIPVKKGDILTMTAEYDLSKHPLRPMAGTDEEAGVMGTWTLVFAPK